MCTAKYIYIYVITRAAIRIQQKKKPIANSPFWILCTLLFPNQFASQLFLFARFSLASYDSMFRPIQSTKIQQNFFLSKIEKNKNEPLTALFFCDRIECRSVREWSKKTTYSSITPLYTQKCFYIHGYTVDGYDITYCSEKQQKHFILYCTPHIVKRQRRHLCVRQWRQWSLDSKFFAQYFLIFLRNFFTFFIFNFTFKTSLVWHFMTFVFDYEARDCS